jgi:hypothetical protein
MTIVVHLGENTSLALLAAQRAEDAADFIALEALPTSDPMVAWAFWNDGGTRKLSASTPAGSTIVGITGTLAEFNAALTGDDFATGGGTATGTNTGDQDLSGYALTSAVAAAYQPLDSDLTAIAALTTTAFGRGFLDLADAAAGRTKLGLVEASAATVNTGTSTTEYVSPDSLAGSNFGTAVASILVSDPNGDAITTGDGKAHWFVPSTLNGRNLVGVAAAVTTVSSSGTPTIQIHNLTQAADMLTTPITIDVSEKHSKDATAAAVIDTANDDVATGDELRIDVDVAGTGAKGLVVELQFRLP